MAGTELFLGCINDNRRQAMLNSSRPMEIENDWVPQLTLEPENGSEPLAVCAFGDSLITYQLVRQGIFRSRKVVQVCQRTLSVRRSIDLIPSDVIKQWRRDQNHARYPINTDVKMAAINVDEGLGTKFCIVITHRNRDVEIVSIRS